MAGMPVTNYSLFHTVASQKGTYLLRFTQKKQAGLSQLSVANVPELTISVDPLELRIPIIPSPWRAQALVICSERYGVGDNVLCTPIPASLGTMATR